jgi:hypothetical protein
MEKLLVRKKGVDSSSPFSLSRPGANFPPK